MHGAQLTGFMSDLTTVDAYKRSNEQLAALTNVISAVSGSLDIDQTLRIALESVLTVIPLDSSAISMIDELTNELVFRAQSGLHYDFVTNPLRVRIDESMSGMVVRTGKTMVQQGRIQDDPRLAGQEFALENTQSMAMAPMHARGKVIGVLSVMSHEPYQFSDDQINVFTLIADQIGVALDNARLYTETRTESGRLEAILSSTADAIIAFDANRYITHFNAQAELVFALHDYDVIGKRFEQSPLPSIILTRLSPIFEKAQPGENIRFEAALATGYHVSVIVSPVNHPARRGTGKLGERLHEFGGWVAVLQDITHIKDSERSRMQFVQMAAHDLRNPLSATLSALTMLAKTLKNSPREDEILNIALGSIGRMQDLIDDVLNLEHLDAGVDMRHEAVDIRELAERVSLEMSPLLARKDQHLNVEVATDLPEFYGDERWLYRALGNLITNAHKYTPNGSHVVIRAFFQPRNEYAAPDKMILEVSDDGPGIPLEAQTRLFERFYRVRSTERIQGTGLGLSLVKSVAEKHGGQASVSSAPDQGTTFRLELPYLLPESVPL